MKKENQTALDWFIRETMYKPQKELYAKEIEEAKEMEKQQIMSAHSAGGSNMEGGYDNFNGFNTDNHYYNEIYFPSKPIQTDSILESLIEKYKQRAEIGQKKYNTTLDRTDLSLVDWINHAQEEAMDLSLYLEKIKTMLNDK